MTDLPDARGDETDRGSARLEGGVVRGREPEVRAVLELVRGAAKGHGGTLLIEGELGAGKSRLVSQAVTAANAEGVSVVAASADELSRFMPLGPVLVALGESSAALASDASAGQADLPVRLIEFLRTQLEKRVAVRPLLVSLDDLHWADPATLHALRTLPWQLASYPLAWILARRARDGDNDAELLFDLLESEGAARISLQPLDDDAVAEMITDGLGALPDPGLLILAAGAAGNPMLLAELVRGLIEEDAVVVTAGRARLRSAHVPGRIQAAVGYRVGRLGGPARQFLETAAVLGRSFRLEDAAVLLGSSPAALLPAVDETLAAGMLVANQDSLAFRREMVWQAVSESLPLPVRQALHRQIGEMLLLRGDSATSAAAHLLSAAHSGDPGALAGLDQAAAETRASSPAIAAKLAARALDLTPPGDPQLIDRSLTAAEALMTAGRLGEATELASSVLAMPLSDTVSARLRCTLSSALWMSGQVTEALNEAMRVLAQPELPGGLRADARLALLEGLTGLRDRQMAGSLAETVLAESQQERADVVVMALLAQAVIMWDQGRLAEAMDLSAEAVRRTVAQPPDARQTQSRLFLASRLVDLRQIEEARTLLRAAADQASPLGRPGWSAGPAVLRARMSLAAGRLDDATAEAQAHLSMASALGGGLHGSGAEAVLATVALRRGDLNAAARQMQSPQASRSDLGDAYPDTWDLVVTAQVEEARHGARAALDMLAGVYAELPVHRFLLMCDPACAAWLVRTALAAGDPDRARAAAAAADEIARGSPQLRVAAVSSAHAGGLIDQDAARLEHAAAEHPDPWARASAAEDLGALLAAAARHREAIARLDQAIEDYEATGAARDAARVRRRLRRLGVRRRHWAVADRPATGWLSLTGTEMAVSELVSEGFTNQKVADQMFISVHTVAFHLRQVFRKLAISSRVELARITVSEAGPPGSQEPPHPS
ncbi:MAG TPA: AAA family ATPase [Streptosporangiaceae bacterium]|jgi:DNA-binding CsgD family transcriptional regulator